eukprot:TRINITY_DN71679_c0_g1_i1.p2 TRINITY_DN71679_c0_g1~~TRINITY_DN71679_c0_g1_i1.p2  ORF type:complete len:112 (-),score=3.14 TRINITY_DN71679_c0_g1_i1:113-448(-)
MGWGLCCPQQARDAFCKWQNVPGPPRSRAVRGDGGGWERGNKNVLLPTAQQDTVQEGFLTFHSGVMQKQLDTTLPGGLPGEYFFAMRHTEAGGPSQASGAEHMRHDGWATN